jgi:hypothetical protein
VGRGMNRLRHRVSGPAASRAAAEKAGVLRSAADTACAGNALCYGFYFHTASPSFSTAMSTYEERSTKLYGARGLGGAGTGGARV